MNKLLFGVLFFVSFSCFLVPSAYAFSLTRTIEQEEAVVYTDSSKDNEHLLVLIDTTEGMYVAYYSVETIFKNTVELIYSGATKFEGNYLSFKGYNSPYLTVFDVDEKEGTITVRYSSNERLPERSNKLITFKRTNKFQGKKFLIGK